LGIEKTGRRRERGRIVIGFIVADTTTPHYDLWGQVSNIKYAILLKTIPTPKRQPMARRPRIDLE